MKITLEQINFEDNGQDFLKWIVKDGIIVDCQPFQASYWVGREVVVDGNIAYVRDGNKGIPVKHQVESEMAPPSDYIEGFNDTLAGKTNESRRQIVGEYHLGCNVADNYLKMIRDQKIKP